MQKNYDEQVKIDAVLVVKVYLVEQVLAEH